MTSDSLGTVLAEVIAFRDARDWTEFHTLRHLAAGIAIEASELQEIMLWKSDAEVSTLESNSETLAKLRHDIADVMIYSLLFCHRLGVDPAAAIREKLAINAQKYPVNLAKGRADKYTEYQRGDGTITGGKQ